MRRRGLFTATIVSSALLLLYASGNDAALRQKIRADYSEWVTAEQDEPLSAQGLYAEYNRLWFSNRLPKNTVVRMGVTPNRWYGCTRKFLSGNFEIVLSDGIRNAENLMKWTLLHEMSHVSVWGQEFESHGPKWQAEMHRLADAKAFDDLW